MIVDSDFGLFSIRFLVLMTSRSESQIEEPAENRLVDFVTFYKVTKSTTTAEILPKHNGSENVAKKKLMTHVINCRKFHTQPGQNGIVLLMA